MNISTIINKLDGLKRSVKVNVSKDEYALQYKKDLDKYRSTVKMDGFRAGKVPEKVILKNYKDRIHGDTINTIIQASLKQSLSENKLDTASPPKIMIEKSGSPEEDIEYTAEFEVFPSISIKNLADINVEVPDVNIDDDDTKGEDQKKEAERRDEERAAEEKR